MADITFHTVLAKAREIHYGSSPRGEARHVADSLVESLLYDALSNAALGTRSGRSRASIGGRFWAPGADEELASMINRAYDKIDVEDLEEVDPVLAAGVKSGVVRLEDQYTAERVRNMKTEVLSRYVANLIMPQTTILNNFFRVIRGDAAESLGQLREYVAYVETISDWTYHMIDPNRGDIRPIEINMAQHAERVTTYMQMYGAKVEYENFLHRVLPNASVAEIFALLSLGWAKASALQREYDASMFLTNYLSPAVAFSNVDGRTSALGQLTGFGINGVQNGTFNIDYDYPRLLDYMEGELGMRTDNLIMLLPRNAWAFFHTKRGYRQFLGLDGSPIYQRPQIVQPQRPDYWPEDRYGIRAKSVGFDAAAAAANYIRGTREYAGAKAAEALGPGVQLFLPEQVPNMLATYLLPNSVFGPMRVVLTPFAQAKHRFYASGHPLRNDPMTGQPRPVLTTDILLFDGNRPLYMIETVPPTSWTATNDEHRKSVVVMVEAYAMANAARGQQAVVIEGAVLDHSYVHDIRLDASSIQVSDRPLGGGMADF